MNDRTAPTRKHVATMSRLLPRWVVEHKTRGDSPMSGRDSFRSGQTGDTGCARSCHRPSRGQPGRPARTRIMASDLKYAWPLIMATLVSGLATSTARRVASADPRVLWIATKRNRAPLNHEPDPPATKCADPVEQDESIGNLVEAPRHPSLAHPILHRQSLRRPTGSWSTLLALCCAHKR
jgi:hypothetical protein